MLSAMSPVAYAEHVDDSLTLDKVMVSGQSLDSFLKPNAQLDKNDINAKQSSVSDTAQLLKGMPGVSLYGAGGVSSLPVVHGFADDRLRIKVDGMDLISACANHMNPPLSYINPTNVQSVKLYSGISPVSMGGDSIGGTIAVESNSPEFAQSPDEVLTKGELGTYYRSNGDTRGANVSATLATENLSINYNGSTAKANNYSAGGHFKQAGPAASDRGFLDSDEVGSSSYESNNQ
ncbi:MAG TPA: TonB-dependent receptor, partial [Methylophaga sp.]|nr:TonB-dependent receptor [Methylophaga sp.]